MFRTFKKEAELSI